MLKSGIQQQALGQDGCPMPVVVEPGHRKIPGMAFNVINCGMDRKKPVLADHAINVLCCGISGRR
jgi:hypothetical protein